MDGNDDDDRYYVIARVEKNVWYLPPKLRIANVVLKMPTGLLIMSVFVGIADLVAQ